MARVLVFALIAILYLYQRSPYVGFNDGLSFLYAADYKWDLATNATSHFLYINTCRQLVIVFSFLPSVLVLTLASVACSLLTLRNVYRIGRLLTPGRPELALVPVVLLGFSFTYWQQSEIIEVYAFNNLLFTTYLYWVVHDLLQGVRKHYLEICVVVGLSLLTHIQHILVLPFLMTYLWWGNVLRISQKVAGTVAWLGIMSVLFVLPLFTGTNDLRSVFFESQFQDDLFGMAPLALLKGVGIGFGMLLYCFHIGLGLVVMGWRRLWRADRRLVYWLLLLVGPWLAFAIKYSVNDNHVFYLIPYIVMVLPAGKALEASSARRLLGGVVLAGMMVPIALYATSTLLAPQVPYFASYDRAKSYKGGVVHLLWPGKRWARDPLQLATDHWHGRTPDPEADCTDEWNYIMALNYLHLKG